MPSLFEHQKQFGNPFFVGGIGGANESIGLEAEIFHHCGEFF